MEAKHKKILKAISLELRHLLEGYYDSDGKWQPGNLEQRLASIGVRRDRDPVPVDELAHLSEDDKNARTVVDAYLQLRDEAGVSRDEAVAEFVRETAYTLANRLLCLRCMEARELIDEVILQKEAYGGRSLEHHRLAQRQPDLCTGEDDGLFAVLGKVFTERAERLPLLFDSHAPGLALKPSPAALKRCLALLSGSEVVRSQEPGTVELFHAPDALGWAYQYWNTEEKDRVFEEVRTVKGAKIEGADIIPATQLYTDDYMVKFLVQNSLGATWIGMCPDSKLWDRWEYYVRDADRAPVEKKPVAEITFLDPACGSGHFLIEAFDLFYDMYVEEDELTEPQDICRSILENNLFGIDIDARAVQIAEAALWMKAAERAFDFQGTATNLVAAVASHLKGDLWEEFLTGFEREPSVARVLRKFGQAMAHIDELGSLARPDEELRAIIRETHAVWEQQVREKVEANFLFPEMVEDAVSSHLPFQEISDEQFGDRLLYRAKAAIDAFTAKAREEGLFQDQLLGHETSTGFKLLEVLGRSYDIVAANPPYMGSRQMGETVKSYIRERFPTTLRDICVTFIERSFSLLADHGHAALVTQQSWLFSPSFADFRHTDSGSGILDRATLSCVVQLGEHAFEEGAAGAVVAMFSIQAAKPDPSTTIVGLSLAASPTPFGKRDRMHKALRHRSEECDLYRRHQMDFRILPGSPVVFWISEEFFRLFAKLPPAESISAPVQGLKTCDNNRFVRRGWEVPQNENGRWQPFVKGEGYRKWTRGEFVCIDWWEDGVRVKQFNSELLGGQHWSRNITNTDRYFRHGLVYTYVARGKLALREIGDQFVVDAGSPLMTIQDTTMRRALLAYLNTRVACYLSRLMSQNLFNMTGVRKIPVPPLLGTPLTDLATLCISLRQMMDQLDVTHPSFLFPMRACPSLAASIRQELDLVHRVSAILLSAEAKAEEHVCEMLDLSDESVKSILAEMGKPAGQFALLSRFDRVPTAAAADQAQRPEPKLGLECHDRKQISSEDLSELRNSLRGFYEAGPDGRAANGNDEVTERSNSDDVEPTGSQVGLPAESFIEELSQRVQVHPVSVYNLLTEGIGKSEWRCVQEDERITANRMTVATLRLLGHRWPTQIEVAQPVPDWADLDGVIPLTEGTDERTLVERFRECVAVEFEGGDAASVEREFAEIMGKPLDKWLTMEFFKHHTKQFKKRPIAWQIQSGKFTARKNPVFACLIYYHKLDSDLLPKIRNQYVGPLRQRLETELRSIENVSTDARSDRQEGRRGELQDQIDELRDFDATLQKVIREGFASKELAKLVKDEPLDKWCSLDGAHSAPESREFQLQQESRYLPDINDGVRVNIAPLQKAGLLAADVLAKKDLDKAIADRAEWRAEERRWCREGKLPQPGWWSKAKQRSEEGAETVPSTWN